MFTPEQQAILQELKKRKLDPNQQAIMTELERRSAPQQEEPSLKDQLVQGATQAFDKAPIQDQLALKAANAVISAPDKLGEEVATTLAGTGAVQDNSLMGMALRSNPLTSLAAYRAARPGEKPQLKTSPEVAAALGTGISMADEIVGGVQGIAGRKILAEGVKRAGQGVGNVAKRVGGRIMEGPATKETRLLRDSLSELPIEKLDKEAQLELLRKQAGTEIEATRDSIGIPQQMYDVSSIDTNSFANMMKTLNPKTKNVESLLKLRDRADAVIRSGVDDTQRAFIRRGMQAIDNQLPKTGVKGEKIAEAYKKYGDVMSATDEIPANITRKRVASNKRIRELQSRSNVEKAIRKWALPALGAGGLLKWKAGN